MKPYKYSNKPDFTNTADDISGTKSKVLIPKQCREVYYNKYEGFSLNCRDLKGAYP